jgi:DNA-binding transcriptional ArsR family regulator
MSAIGRVSDAIEFSAIEHRRGCNCIAHWPDGSLERAGDRLPFGPIHKTSDIGRASSAHRLRHLTCASLTSQLSPALRTSLDYPVSYDLPLVMAYATALTILADPTRRKVFERLRAGPRPVNALAAGLPVSRPAVSQHLKALKDAGLVEERSEGVRRIYSLRREGLTELRDWLDTFWDDALAAFKEEAEKTKGVLE